DHIEVSGYTVEPSGELVAGTKEVTIRYTEGDVEKTTTQAITVKKKETPNPEAVLEGISITKAPDKTEYKEGEKFDSAGMEVTATYSDKTTKKVSGYTVEPSGELVAGTKEITIRYTEGDVEKTTTQAITVKKKETPNPEAVLEGISVTKTPDKTEYKEGEKFDSAGMEVTATYSDKTTKKVSGYTVELSGELVAGTKEVTIRYTEGDVEKTTTQTITVAPKKDAVKDREWTFKDLKINEKDWKYNSARYVYNRYLMNGVGGNELFQPDQKLTRGMFATILYRMAKEPKVQFTDLFSDVVEGRWYSNAILWVNEMGIAQGYGDGSFGWELEIRRAELVKMLYLYGEKHGLDMGGRAELASFTDVDSVDAWAEDYLKWAVQKQMITGKPNGDDSFRLDPKGKTTRAECTKMLMMFMEAYGIFE
ncbi:MAG: S-layer homology domain-containing protein, partial [Lachnospiraceae bacterium]|nr:S-layer homology domain-containing protein [Lachnospiraceae bacterium]